MYQALYRKYRPRAFSDVTGQEHITTTLRRQIASGRLSHAYLFVGTRGTGKTTCAKILSRAVNCLNPRDGDPCNECASCVGIETGGILDVLELDAASNNGVSDVRALRDEAVYTPASVNKRVYIIDEVHMLSTPAFNALLKILEEPPEHLLFILATTELHKVPKTILSRCQRFLFKRIPPAAIVGRLRAVAGGEGLDLSDEAAEKLAALADGSMRDAVSLLDQCAVDTTVDLERVLDTIGLTGSSEVAAIASMAADGDTSGTLAAFDKLYADGRDMTSLLGELASLMRDALVYRLAPDSPLLSGAFDGAALKALSAKLAPERVFSWLDIIRETLNSLSRGGIVRLSVEMCLIRLCSEQLSDDTASLLARIAKLENQGPRQIRNENVEIKNVVSEAKMPTAKGFGDIDEDGEVTASEPHGSGDEAVGGATEPEPDEGTDTYGDAIEDEASGYDKPDYEDEPDESMESDNDSEGGPDFWTGILRILESDPALYAVVKDYSQVSAEMRGDILLLQAKDMFSGDLLGTDEHKKTIADAAYTALGRVVAVRVEVAGSDEDENQIRFSGFGGAS
uniref:DNA polymerase III subunit gamma/tau n=1 Tax=uncultured bacterium contig00102 TaxID=1181569 RepID=A0A806K163_9BACT|nr:DNA polymerase III subunits gamma and tau [uncultured bacterium contig00102]